ncbi:MAG: hypothetical protein HY703_00695 [Gemmatimonadetes bacterium]|nr:hypothetical protein [Gemmatimonadota bacterium]
MLLASHATAARRLAFAAVLAGLLSPASVLAQRSTIHGVVRYRGSAPVAAKLKVTKDREFCGESVASRRLLAQGGKLRDAVVYLEGPVPVNTPIRTHTLSNVGCDFDPPVQVAEVGGMLVLRNNDAIMHNVHLYLAARTIGNVALPFKGVELQNRRALSRPGLVEVKCDAHEWMRARIWVFDHPYYGLTGVDGAFQIRDVLPGKYVLRAWHQELGEQRREIEVFPGKELVVDFAF